MKYEVQCTEKMTVGTSSDYDRIINDWKNDTNYFESAPFITVDEMIEMFQDCRFGYAETQVILASLMKCGAKFNN